MKRLILTLIIASAALCANAQPRAVGVRFGVTGIEASYEHNINKLQFVEGNMGIDYGNKVNGMPGIKAEGTYNFIWARPAWTNKGSWALYAGPGITTGYVHDDGHLIANDGVSIVSFQSHGFMLGICAQVGLEYTFWFPLQLSVDLRPTVGLHANKIEGGAFYDNGLLGFVPSVSVRYRF